MTETKIDALVFASAGAIIVISLTAAALISVNALVVSGSIVVTSMLMAGVTYLCMRRQRKGRRQIQVSPEVREFMREGERFRAHITGLAIRAAVREP